MKIPHITIKNIFIVPETTDLGKVTADLRELGNKVGETFLKITRNYFAKSEPTFTNPVNCLITDFKITR